MWRCENDSFETYRIYGSDKKMGPYTSSVASTLDYLSEERFDGSRVIDKKELLLPTELL